MLLLCSGTWNQPVGENQTHHKATRCCHSGRDTDHRVPRSGTAARQSQGCKVKENKTLTTGRLLLIARVAKVVGCRVKDNKTLTTGRPLLIARMARVVGCRVKENKTLTTGRPLLIARVVGCRVKENKTLTEHALPLPFRPDISVMVDWA